MATLQQPTLSWRSRAPKRPPTSLRRLTHLRLTSLFTNVLSHPSSSTAKSVRALGSLLRSCLPPQVLTPILEDVNSDQDLIAKPEHVVTLLRINLNADVTHLRLRGTGMELNNLLEEECDSFTKELEDMKELRLESLHLEGVSLKPGLMSCLLRKAPGLQSLHVSGILAEEVLEHLRSHPCELQSLHLQSCCVSDEEIVRALLWPELKRSSMADVICSDEDLTKPGKVRGSSLRRVSVISPLLTVGGAMVLLRALPNLRYLHYTWFVPVCESLRLLQQLCPSVTSYAISHLDLSLVSGEALTCLGTLCPGLRSLEMEGCNSSVQNLEALGSFTSLTSLSLRLVPEPLVVSAVKAVGHNLLHLRVEYEECVFKLLSFAALRNLQDHCLELQSLELVNVCLSGGSRHHHRTKSISPAFPDLTRLVVEGVASSPDILASLISHNRSLEHMTLAVNQDALTDQVIKTLLAQNDLSSLSTLHLGAGNLSPVTLTSLLTLPDLTCLTLDLKRFPFIPESTFASFQNELRSTNCLCRLERLSVE